MRPAHAPATAPLRPAPHQHLKHSSTHQKQKNLLNFGTGTVVFLQDDERRGYILGEVLGESAVWESTGGN